jgi:hypothetical protein
MGPSRTLSSVNLAWCWRATNWAYSRADLEEGEKSVGTRTWVSSAPGPRGTRTLGPTVTTGQGELRKIFSATEPSRSFLIPVLPRVPTITKSIASLEMSCEISSDISPSLTIKA